MLFAIQFLFNIPLSIENILMRMSKSLISDFLQLESNIPCILASFSDILSEARFIV